VYKAVFDTNVYVSAAVYGGKPEILFKLSWKPHNQFELYTSHEILKETVRILTSEKFGLGREEIADTVASIVDAAKVVEPGKRLSVIDDDPDNRVLECAVQARTGFIISGDSHLIDLEEFKGVRILKTAEFLALIETR